MPISVTIPGGILHMADSRAKCPHCGKMLNAERMDKLLTKSKLHYTRMRCVCGVFVGITTDYKGDFVCYSLKD